MNLAAVPTVLTRVLADVPVVPDADTARRWAQEELAHPIYRERESLLNALLRWISEQLTGMQVALAGVDARAVAVVVAAIVLAVVLVALLVAGPVRRTRRAARTSTALFVDDTRTADELRASADALAADGRWSEAVLDRFRAVLRAMEERAVLDERPGRTADEAAADASAVLPACAADLHRASRLFDDVCYGDVEADEADDAWLRQVDRAVAATRRAGTPARTEQLALPR